MRHGLLTLLVAGALLAGCTGVGAPPAQQPAAPAQTPAPEAPKGEPEKKPAPLRGYPAPEIAGKDVRTGEAVSLSQFKGKTVVVNFWATWCPPCREEMPDLQILQDEMGEEIKVLAVGGDRDEPAERLLAYANDRELKFTVLYDEGMALLDYRAIALPTTFIIDRNGIIREKIQGAMTLDQMHHFVNKAIEAGKNQP
ncbi:MAG TPA: TlpA disulfide reductase family protein [Symbiobacteriaceae bacterium]|nr:TlpA disulfide reductase family protein [Symbiobacteriaceae bacterium]